MAKYLKNILAECVLLLEYDRALTMKQHGPKVLKALEQSPDATFGMTHRVEKLAHHLHKSGDSEGALGVLMGHFEQLDPSPQKKHVPHMARIYANGGIERFEDMGRVGQALHTHHELSKRKIIPQELRDAGRFKTLHTLEDVVQTHEHLMSGKEEDAAHHEKMKSEATISEHPEHTHIIPHTKEAAAHFGKGTRWCTATKDVEMSMYDEYANRGNLHIIIPKNPKYPGEKYQYHHNGESQSDGKWHYTEGDLMDEKDDPAFGKLQENHPEIRNHLKNYVDSANEAKNTKEGLNHPEPWVRAAAVNAPGVESHDIDAMLAKEKNPFVKVAATAHLPDDDPRPYEAMDHAYNNIRAREDLDAMSHPGHFKAILDDEEDREGIHYRVAYSKGLHRLPQEYKDKLIHHEDPDVTWHLANNEHAPSDMLQALVDKGKEHEDFKSDARDAKAILDKRAAAKQPKRLRQIVNHNPTTNSD